MHQRPRRVSGGFLEAPGAFQKAPEAPGGPRKPQESPGDPRRPQEAPRTLQKAPECHRTRPQSSQKAPKGSRSFQKAPESLRGGPFGASGASQRLEGPRNPTKLIKTHVFVMLSLVLHSQPIPKSVRIYLVFLFLFVFFCLPREIRSPRLITDPYGGPPSCFKIPWSS